MASGSEVNLGYYGRILSGRNDYWRKMAAPRFRVQSFLMLLDEYGAASGIDLGCGNGQLLAEIRRHDPKIALAGIDLSPALIEANRAAMPEIRFQDANLDGPVSFPADLEGSFEAVFASEIIEHLDHPDTFLENALRLAAPGRGRLFLSTQTGPIRTTERNVGHRQHFDASQMRRLLERTGWQPVRIWNCGFPFHDLSKWYANLRPDASMRRFGDQAYGPVENAICYGLRLAFTLNSDRRGAQLFAIGRRPSRGATA